MKITTWSNVKRKILDLGMLALSELLHRLSST